MSPTNLFWRICGTGGLLIGLLLWCGAGCSSPPQRGAADGTAQSGPIADLHLLCIPVALNFDQDPAPDGFAVKIFASTQTNPKTIPITRGSVEFLMFDGLVAPTEVSSKKPKRIWTYSARQLASHFFKSSVGVGYQFTPSWGTSKPSGNRITVVARYLAPNGFMTYSTPSVIAVNPQ